MIQTNEWGAFRLITRAGRRCATVSASGDVRHVVIAARRCANCSGERSVEKTKAPFRVATAVGEAHVHHHESRNDC